MSCDLLLLTPISTVGGQPAQGTLSKNPINNTGLLAEPNAEQGEVPPNVEHPHGSCCSPSPLPLERTAFAEKPFTTK